MIVNIIFYLGMVGVPHDNIVASKQSVVGLVCPARSMDCAGITWTIIGGNFISQGMTVTDEYQNKYYVNSTGGYCTLYIRLQDMTPIPPINCVQLTKAQKIFYVFVTGRISKLIYLNWQ